MASGSFTIWETAAATQDGARLTTRSQALLLDHL